MKKALSRFVQPPIISAFLLTYLSLSFSLLHVHTSHCIQEKNWTFHTIHFYFQHPSNDNNQSEIDVRGIAPLHSRINNFKNRAHCVYMCV